MDKEFDLFKERLLEIQDNLYNFAYMLTSDKEEAKDLLQDTTLKALDNRDKYIDNINFKGWLFTIMRNIFINNYRRVVRNQTMVDQTEDLFHLNLPQESGFDTPDGSYTIKEINSTYRHIDKVTDVISFENDEGFEKYDGFIVLGDLFICVSKAKSQAKNYGHSMYREVCFLFTHGLLHLLKMDHLNKEDEEKMIAMQNEIMDHFKIVR